MRYFVFLLFLGSAAFAQTNKITVSFYAPSYAGDSLEIRRVQNFITESSEVVCTSLIDSSGYYNCSFEAGNTEKYFIPLNAWNGVFYAEPGHDYHLIIPSKTKLRIEDELNPYFIPADAFVAFNDNLENELNNLIYEFDSTYESYISVNFWPIYYNGYYARVDTFELQVKQMFKSIDNPYFNDYLTYRMAQLRFLTKERDNDFVINYYLNNHSVAMNNPAYVELFNNVFGHYFSLIVKTKWGERIYDDIARGKSPSMIRETLKKNPVITNDTLVDYIIIKGLYDAINDSQLKEYASFPRTQILLTLDSMRLCGINQEVRNAAAVILEDQNLMRTGKPIPEVFFTDKNGNKTSSATFRGKITYISFIDTRSYSSRFDLLLLRKMYEKHGNELDLITVICNNDYKSMLDFVKENNIEWTVLFPEDVKLARKKFKVVAFPAYYLVDEYGILMLSPAPAPGEAFDAAFVGFKRSRQ